MVVMNFIFDLQRFVYIENTNSNTLLSGTEGADYIYNESGNNVSINAGAGNDYILNDDGKNVKIDGGDGNDKIINYGDKVIIASSAGNDTIHNLSDNSSLNAGTGNDSIQSHGHSDLTITGGKGNDTIDLSTETKNVTIVYNIGDGDDVIKNYNPSHMVSLMGGSMT